VDLGLGLDLDLDLDLDLELELDLDLDGRQALEEEAPQAHRQDAHMLTKLTPNKAGAC